MLVQVMKKQTRHFKRILRCKINLLVTKKLFQQRDMCVWGEVV